MRTEEMNQYGKGWCRTAIGILSKFAFFGNEYVF